MFIENLIISNVITITTVITLSSLHKYYTIVVYFIALEYMFLLLLKQYIYSSKFNNNSLSLNVFKTVLVNYYYSDHAVIIIYNLYMWFSIMLLPYKSYGNLYMYSGFHLL